jgi:hypothetical protein
MGEELNYGVYEIFEITIVILSVLIVLTSLFYVKDSDIKEYYILGKEIEYISSNVNSNIQIEIKPPNKFFKLFNSNSEGKFEIDEIEFNSLYKNVKFEKDEKNNLIIIN